MPDAPVATELQESFYLASWLEWARVFFIHVPNGELRPFKEKIDRRGRKIRYSPAGQRLKRMGAKAGVADYIIFDPPPANPELKGTVIELKRKGEGPTSEQLLFLEQMRKRGWYAFWIEGGEAATEKLQELGYGERIHF